MTSHEPTADDVSSQPEYYGPPSYTQPPAYAGPPLVEPAPQQYPPQQYPPQQYPPQQYPPQQYPPQQYPPQQYPPQQYGYPPYPTRPVAPRSVAGLARALRILLSVQVVLYIAQFAGWAHEYRLIADLQADRSSVLRSQGEHADDFVGVLGSFIGLGYLAIVVVFLVWFYRVRQNAGSYNSRYQRHSQGWAIGSWFCPGVWWVFPRRMTNDILVASEATPGTRNDSKISVGIVNAWWAAWLVNHVFFLVAAAISGGSDDAHSLGQLKTHAVVNMISPLCEATAAVLLIAVVRRISRAQARRRGLSF